jgi:YqjK-like protein
MTKEQQLLAQERGRLMERIAHQRVVFSVQLVPLQRALNTGDRAIAVGRSGWQFVRVHRAAIALVAGVVGSVFVVLKPGRAVRLARRGFVLWRSWRSMQAMGLFLPGSLWATAFNTIRQRYF